MSREREENREKEEKRREKGWWKRHIATRQKTSPSHSREKGRKRQTWRQ
jgi:hypothetical protein